VKIVPINLREASAFIDANHRHNSAPRGMRFAVGLIDDDGELIGVGVAGRPLSRVLDPMSVIEINRTCTTGEPNANSMIYGALRRAAKALGYTKVITYSQVNENGSSLRAAGFRLEAELPPRPSWADSSGNSLVARDPVGTGGVARRRWVWP
jgi:hypothetical protein